MAAAPAPRKSAEVRREEILVVALEHFAEGGFHGTSTEVIAREAGISQPYLFRLFRTKRELFLACVERCYGQVGAVFAEAADGEVLERDHEDVLAALLGGLARADRDGAAHRRAEG